jgi:AcrR family transcriptional regulator
MTPPITAPAPKPARRLSRAARRDQLLDTAAELLLDRGASAVTMEGVAALAGVSKALPYTHFDNAIELLRALRDRELDYMRDRIDGATEVASGYEPKIAAAVHAYFDVLRDRGDVLAAVLRSLPMDDQDVLRRENPHFYADLFEQELGLTTELAQLTSSIFVAAVPGAAQSWAWRRTHRATAEATLVRVIVAGAAAVADAAAEGTLRIPSSR